ncbi:MAG: A22B family peptidase, partial [Thaumarchaeota archaeon]|nr:A22B family peptidase [Nitrososphaerota archaeon]
MSSWDPRALLAYADLLYIEVRLVASAMGIIFLGAHAALRRPPSAALPKPRAKDKKPRDEKADHFAEGLTPSDAVVFPFMAGIVLVGLYYIIQWLQDPAILNKILRVYMSTVSVVSMSKLSADALHLLTNLVFPSVWADSKGSVYRVHPGRCRHCLLSGVSAGHAGQPMEERKTPFPGKASDWALKDRTNNVLWALRHLLTEEWTVRFAIHGIFHEKFAIRLNDMIAVLVAVAVTSTYYLTNAPWLANLMGFGFCYGAFMIMSCTTFSTGTLVLMGLFFYDIVMVFYTYVAHHFITTFFFFCAPWLTCYRPFMITVATKIDAPIKLVFEGAARPDGTPRSSLLGLGDIVIPGIFMCLSMRFDLYRYWLKQIRYEPTELTTEMTSGGADEKTTALVSTETRYRAVRAPFVDPQGRWGDRLWTTRKWSRLLSSPTATPELLASAFPKTYFYASIVGYGIGMVLTLSMLLLFQHGQPALLYLV